MTFDVCIYKFSLQKSERFPVVFILFCTQEDFLKYQDTNRMSQTGYRSKIKSVVHMAKKRQAVKARFILLARCIERQPNKPMNDQNTLPSSDVSRKSYGKKLISHAHHPLLPAARDPLVKLHARREQTDR